MIVPQFLPVRCPIFYWTSIGQQTYNNWRTIGELLNPYVTPYENTNIQGWPYGRITTLPYGICKMVRNKRAILLGGMMATL